MTEDPKTELLIQIHDLIDETFNLAEFRDLCFRLGVKYDNLRGENLSERIHDLVQLIYRRRRLDDLLNFCGRLRPKIEWPDLSEPVALDTGSEADTIPTRNSDQIFISHARQDADFAHKLADDLRLHGWEIWIAPDSIQPGEKWVDAINRGLTESGLFLLALTPDAVGSTWVHSETNVAINLQHQSAIRFIPLDVKPATVPPLWQAYQWIPFQCDYKSGLERLLQELQPEKIAKVAGLYRQMYSAVGRQEWGLVQALGEEISTLYPNYRETEIQIALAQQEEAREKELKAEAAKLYKRLQPAFDLNDWATVLTLTRQVETLVPNYRDVNQLAARARQGQGSNRRDAIGQYFRFIPVWGWGGGVIVSIFAVIFFFQLAGNGGDDFPTSTPTITDQAISHITLEAPMIMMTPVNNLIIVPTSTSTNIPTSTSTNIPTSTSTNIPTSTSTNTPTYISIESPTPSVGSTRKRPKDQSVMVYVPEGEFLMGNDNGNRDEQPFHEVYLDSYWIDQTEVTNGMYALCEKAGYCKSPPFLRSSTRPRYYGDPVYVDYPMIYVSWDDAKKYCEWIGGRLPTEAEWEKVARWDDVVQESRTYPWGENIGCDYANIEGCVGDTSMVGSYPTGASFYGALDMIGNVLEWTASSFESYPYYPDDGRDDPNMVQAIVLRGSSWISSDDFAYAAFRHTHGVPPYRSYSVGFRCARD